MADETKLLIQACRDAVDAALDAGRSRTNGGKDIDDHQVHA
jgi:hypothetical protein